MEKGFSRVTYTIGVIGTVIGLALIVVSLVPFLLYMASPGAVFFLIFTAIGVVTLVSGLICMVSAKQSKDRPWLGASLLIITAVVGSNLGFPIILTGIMGLLGMFEAFKALRQYQKVKSSKI